MSIITVKTNNQVRELVGIEDLSTSAREEFDYVDDNESAMRFFKYKGEYYDAHEFIVIPDNAPDSLKEWDGQHSETAFSGILLKFADDNNEHVIVGAYFS